jgi:hypothetical protein
VIVRVYVVAGVAAFCGGGPDGVADTASKLRNVMYPARTQ